MCLGFADSAVNDLQDIIDYYQAQGLLHIATALVANMVEHIETLPNHPQIGHIVPEFSEVNLRELINPPFRVVYWLDNQAIQILRIWRSERLLKLPDSF